MLRWFYILPHLILEAGAARRDARVRFLNAQIDILRHRLGGRRIIARPAERARLLALGAELDQRVAGIIRVVTPRTYARWVVEQESGRHCKPVGRPKIARDIPRLVRRLARENAGWGYRRIVGELRKLRVRIGSTTVQRILKEAGITPAPTRRSGPGETIWRKFIRLHINTLVACDFFTKAIITPMGPRLAYILVFIHAGSRRIFMSPATYNPYGGWVEQQARNVMMWLDDQRLESKYILHDRDAKFSTQFGVVFRQSGFRQLRIPAVAPNANAFAESWIGSFKRECLNHFSCFSLGHLDHIAQTYSGYYNQLRPHQGLGNRTLIEAATGPPDELNDVPNEVGRVRSKRFLGGLLQHYYRAA